jgi:16S rRNA (guanine527-N7)-methyltransferase
MDLNTGLSALSLSLSKEAQDKALAFLDLLEKWNQAYNLTAIKTRQAMITHHLLDSFALAPYLKGHRILDVGSGAGFPGIPLALYFPNKVFTLLDSNGKKTRFLAQVKSALSITNIEIVQKRAENYQTAHCFDAIIFRAVKPIPEMLKKTQHLCCKDGQTLAMKGSYPTEELDSLDQAFAVQALTVPGLDAERHVIIIEGSSNG